MIHFGMAACLNALSSSPSCLWGLLSYPSKATAGAGPQTGMSTPGQVCIPMIKVHQATVIHQLNPANRLEVVDIVQSLTSTIRPAACTLTVKTSK